MKKLITFGTAIVVVLALGAGCASQGATQEPVSQVAVTKAKAHGHKKQQKQQTQKLETVSQANARQTAEDYLSSQSFSRTGLIKQLKYEGFSTNDATYGVDAVSPDWNQQAVKTAKDYLDGQSFSHSGLVGQLKYDGFTQAQAEYGVSKTGL